MSFQPLGDFIKPTHGQVWMDQAVELMRQLWMATQDLQAAIRIPQKAAPSKPRDGMIRYADGENWDPGYGPGLYQYLEGLWLPMVNGRGWDDMRFSPTATKLGSNTKPDFNYADLTLDFPQNDATEILYISDQMSHSWLEGSTIYPHVHWLQAANQTPVFKVDYKFYNNGEAPPANWTTYTMDQLVFTYTSGTLAQINKGSSGIALPDKQISFIMKMKLYRQDNVYTGDAKMNSFDIHYQVDSNGSRQEYIK